MPINFRRLFLPATLAIAIPLLAACGGSDGATPTPSGSMSVLVNVELKECDSPRQSVGPGPHSVQRQKYRDAGAQAGRLKGGGVGDFPLTDDGKVEELAGEVIGEIVPDELQPEDQVGASFAMGSGAYILLCNLFNHYQ